MTGRRPCVAAWALALLPALATTAAPAAEFRSAGETAVVLYDAPSVKARKLYIVNRGYPLEVVVEVEGWTKVRDAAGALTWAEAKSLNKERSLLVRTAVAAVRQKPAEDAPVVFEAQRDVLLDFVEAGPAGWVQVRHRDGSAGYARAADVWGN